MKVAAVAVLLTLAMTADAEDCSVRKYLGFLSKDSVVIRAGDGWTGTSATTSTTLNTGADYWRDGCADGEGTKFASISVGGSTSGAYPVTVNFVDGPGERCGRHVADIPSGATVPVGSTITLWASAGGASCAPIADSLAHELGHVLGLRDPIDPTSCGGSIMGARQPGGTRTVTSDDCAEVDKAWLVMTEKPAAVNPDPICPDSGCSKESPIVLSLGGGSSYRFTSAADGVYFDIRDDGSTIGLAWTRAGAQTVFLALDRNGNGGIDSGAELFGNATPLRIGGHASNGFEALQELDDNRDGAIDAADSVWNLLLLWADTDHDGHSTAAELQPIATSAVKSLATSYRRVGRKDQWGNELVFQSEFRLAGSSGDEVRPYYDVFFVTR